MRRFLPCVFLIAGLFLPLPAAQAQAPLTINLVAVNASETESKEKEVKYYLPKELTPEDVLDSGQLKVDYDVEKSRYFVYGEFMFQPKESRTFKIRVNDVWRVTGEEIDVMKTQLEENFSFIDENHENYDEIVEAKDKIVAQLDFILAQQSNYSANIGRRIEEYRAYRQTLEKIRGNAYNLDFLKEEAMELARTEEDTVRFIIEVTNPEDKERTIQHKHFLPEEVRESHVIESRGFDIRYDEVKEKAYLTKEETFQPNETKKYEIVLEDIWVFSLTKVDVIEERAQLAFDELQESVYAESGQFLFDSIMESLNAIRGSADQEGLPIQQHIGMHRINERRYEEVKRDLERIEQMMAIVRAKKLEEMEDNKVKNVLERMQALRGLQNLSEALFKKGISVTVTWRIIFGTLAFIGVFTTYHFYLWSRRSKTMGEDLAPPSGEGIKVVPKPGQGEGEEEEDEA